MPVLNRIADYAEEMKGWRRYLHQHPELEFQCHATADFIVVDMFAEVCTGQETPREAVLRAEKRLSRHYRS